MIVQRRQDSGFTLTEVLVALFIFSLISVGSLSAMSSSLQAKASIKTQTEAMREIDLARAILTSDMGALQRRVARDIQGGFQPYIFEGGSDVLLRFTRSGRDNPAALSARGDIQRVEYIFDSGRLIRRARLQANPAPDTPYSERILLEGLTHAELRFDTSLGPVTQVLIPAGSAKELPPLMTLVLTFETGETLTQTFGIEM
ncbi:type II secretion system minor pseudopilin GspJ [Robiginitomaculum antarcticum]|uniref:type II secretion system minor pseudopilin GspJ n=1 Tax=Robiginitomaculum antarcticum TaxID=437507 RepID=UPI00037022C4|nr:type II secretion system minor pseudopilin GspJ [Robiginitomaculum antarcticum]